MKNKKILNNNELKLIFNGNDQQCDCTCFHFNLETGEISSNFFENFVNKNACFNVCFFNFEANDYSCPEKIARS